jgi:hypothetical protein
MKIDVGYDGYIKFKQLSEEEKDRIRHDTTIYEFIKRIALTEGNILVIDRSPDVVITGILLKDDMERSEIQPNQLHEAGYGYSVVWVPWGEPREYPGFKEVIEINPPRKGKGLSKR